MYSGMISLWDGDNILQNNESIMTPFLSLSEKSGLSELDFLTWMSSMDTLVYLPDDILVKVDRAGMSVSLESRVPFLDPDISEFSITLPNSFKYRDGKGKWILRQILKKYLPDKLFERPKMGFAVPVDRWLKEDLKDWAEDLLDSKRMREEGFFNVRKVEDAWKEHLNGVRNRHYELWTILMFQSWFRNEQQ
jgi:asparagine synthase (glutamine-hydrolysing)